MASGMKAEEVRSGLNSSLSVEITEKDKIVPNSELLTYLQFILILENSIITAYQYPDLLISYLKNEEETKILDIASTNWHFVSNAECKINEHFTREYLKLLGVSLRHENQISEVRKILDQCLLKSAEMIQSRIRDNFEFAVFCQISLIKVAVEFFKGNEFPEFLNLSIARLRQCFQESFPRNPIERSTDYFNDIVGLAAKIHEYRLNYRGKVIQFCQNLNFNDNIYINNNILSK